MNDIHSYAIVGIDVVGLFGYIDQSLQANEDNRDKIAQLAILYGENGTGKTTLLRLVFHLLSPRVDRGHKTRLAETTFKSLCVTLRDGTKVQATRDEARSGSYQFSVKCPGKRVLVHQFTTDDVYGARVMPYEFHPDLQRALLDRASTVFFLRDDRSIEVEQIGDLPRLWEESDAEFSGFKGKKIHRSDIELLRDREDPDRLGTALLESIERLNQWFSVQYGQRTSTGMASSHAIYEEVIGRVASDNKPQQPERSFEALIEKLKELSQESTIFESYGLSTKINVVRIIESFKSSNEQKARNLYALLTPYIDTVEARFVELREIYKTIDTFVSHANHFMSPKRITYRIGEGLRIYSPRDQRLNPTELSSGERHLLLILTSAVLARSRTTLFIIDEPELSLNATWQRDLAGALLAISKNSVSQFLLASHSLPLITPYRDHVLRLKQGERQKP